MSLRVQSWVYEHSEATGNERLILLAIADEADDDGANAYPSIDRIALKARVNKRTTIRCLERLESTGRLVVTRPTVNGRGHHNSYVVVMTEEKGDILSPSEKVTEGRVTARNGAQASLIGSRPIDPQTQDPEINNLLAVADSFTAFFTTFPRKTAKGEARKAWPAALKAAGGADAIIAGATRYANDPNRDPSFTKHPASWLRGECWDDEPLPPRSKPTAKPKTADSAMAADPDYWGEP